MEWLKIVHREKNPIPLTGLSPEEQRQEVILTLQAAEIKTINPGLYWQMYRDWLLSFHVEDLDELPEPTWLDQAKEIAPWAIAIVALLLAFFR